MTTPPSDWRAEFWEPLQTRIDRKYAESQKTSFDDEDFLRECNHLHSIQELLNPQLENLLASQSAAHEMKMKEVVEKIKKYEDIFAWLQGERYDFPPKQENDPPYYWRKALRIKLEAARLS